MMIKVSDFGLSHKLYESKDYYRLSSNEQHAKLPIKWMAIESISDSVFSEKSDMVSDERQNSLHKYTVETLYMTNIKAADWQKAPSTLNKMTQYWHIQVMYNDTIGVDQGGRVQSNDSAMKIPSQI